VAKRVPNMMGFTITGVPAGQGGLNVPWILKTLRESGATGNVILEQWPPSLESELPMAEESIAYLRPLFRPEGPGD